jgi:hypothetical protein
MAGAMEPAPASNDSTTPEPRSNAEARWLRLRRLLPWLSLGVGLFSAIFMERGPRRGALVAIAAIVIWIALILQQWLRELASPEHTWLVRLVWVGRRSSLMATQSLLQLTLFFALPFFVQAADLHDFGHDLFLFGLVTLSGLALWDPLTEWLLAKPRLGPILPAVSSFAALTAVLPGLGLSTHLSLWIAAFVSSSGMALLLLAAAPRGARRARLPFAILTALALPLALGLGLARIVPAAPLRLVKLEFGAHAQDHWVKSALLDGANAPERLYCATAVSSPLGVHDRLFHVWQKDETTFARIELEIQGGRSSGFRTVSRIGLGAHSAGRYRCSVETSSGQVLGGKSVRLNARGDSAN